MLEELYKYALANELMGRPGFKPKRPKAYFHLSAFGDFLSLEIRDKNAPEVMAPDVGAAANGTRFCNVLIEKAGICLCIVNDEKKDKNIPVKHEFFLSFLEGGKKAEPLFGIAAEALRDQNNRELMKKALEEQKLKPADAVGFAVDGKYLECSEKYLEWWEQFRSQFQPDSDGKRERCLITGNLSRPMTTVPKVSGLVRVGGHTSGDALLCFDKDAFQSYGLKQSANASVSEEGMTAVNAALRKLIQEAYILAGTKMVHWYSSPVSEEEDVFSMFLGSSLIEGEEEAVSEEEKKRDALWAAGKLVRAIREGKMPDKMNFRYYILPLSGAGGRMMVRGWQEGSYEELYENVCLWFEDLQLILPDGKGMAPHPELKQLCLRMLKPGGGSEYDRLDRELANLTQRIVYAGIQGNPLPDEAAVRAVQWLKSSMVSGEKNTKGKQEIQGRRETLVYQLLKAWLRRKQRKRGEEMLMKEELNEENRSVAYSCGRLLAVYSVIQEKAMPQVNVGIAERFFVAAMTRPGQTIGKLSQLSQHHLAKLEKGLAVYYENMLSEISVNIGNQKIPTVMNTLQQTEFALGYYQQRAKIFSGKK